MRLAPTTVAAAAAAATTALALFLWSNGRLLRHNLMTDGRRRKRQQQQSQQQQSQQRASQSQLQEGEEPTATAAAAATGGDHGPQNPLAVVRKKDLARQGLTRVPREVLQLRGLTELNLMGNCLVELPEEIGGLTQLFRLGLKDNALEALPESIGNLSNLVELYLTNNRLAALPASLGRLRRLRKLQASFNRLQSLPESMRQMEALELFRAACNPGLAAVPPHLAQAPALTWLSFGGSRFCDSRNALDTHGHDEEEDDANDTTTPSSPWWRHAPLPVVPLSSLALAQKLGDGASGDVYKAQWGEGGKEAAVKLFRGDTGPDGRAVDELEVLCLVDHPALTKVRAVVVDDTSASSPDAAANPEDTSAPAATAMRPAGVVMDLVEGAPLAEKPNATSVLRCRWEAGRNYPLRFLLSVGAKLAGALQHLHALGVMHGDVYAHNVVATPDGARATLLDYGASFRYGATSDDGGEGGGGVDFERLEVRALGLLLADLLARCPEAAEGSEEGAAAAVAVKELVERCLLPRVAARPTFAEVGRALSDAAAVEREKAGVGAGARLGSPRIPAE